MTEKIKVTGYKQLLDILEKEGLNSKPSYSGFGLEVYQSYGDKLDVPVQVIYNCRGDNNEVTINRGY